MIFVIFIIPLSFIFGPAVLAGYGAGLLVTFLRMKKKQGVPKTKTQRQQDDELITVIQPTINSKG